MLGPAGAICGVSPPPPLATPRSHRRPYWLLVTSPCQDQGVGRGVWGGGRAASLQAASAMPWVLWRGLQRMIPERLEPFANPRGNKAGIISFHELGASAVRLPSSWRGSPLQWPLSRGAAAAKAPPLCRGGRKRGMGRGCMKS